MQFATRFLVRTYFVALFLFFSVALPGPVQGASGPALTCHALFKDNSALVSQQRGLLEPLKTRSENFSEFKQSMDLIESSQSDLALLENSKDFIQLTEKLKSDSNATLTEADFNFLMNHPKAIPLQHGIALLFDAYSSSVNVMKAVISYWQLRPASSRIETNSNLINTVINPMEKTLRGIGSLLNPLSFLPNRVDRIFLAQENNPRASLGPSDRTALERLHLLQSFEDRKDFIQRHPRWTIFRRWVYRVVSVVLVSSNLLVMNHELQLSQNMVSANQYQTQAVRSQSREQIDVLVDIGRFTHLAVQMDGKVYSYGVKSVNVVPVAQYMQAREEKNYNHLAARSFQVIRINLPADQRAQFKRDLEFSAYKYYDNKTFINDCATMIARNLRKTTTFQPPQIIDASPSQMGMYLSLLKTVGAKNVVGQPLVADELQVGIEDAQRKVFHLLRNGYYNMVESALFIRSMPLLQSQRAHLDLTKQDSDLQWWAPEVQQQLNEMRKEQIELLKEDPQIQFLEAQIESAKSSSVTPEDAQKNILVIKKLAYFYFSTETKKAQAIRESFDTDFNDAMAAEFRVEVLKQKKDELDRKISALTP